MSVMKMNIRPEINDKKRYKSYKKQYDVIIHDPENRYLVADEATFRETQHNVLVNVFAAEHQRDLEQIDSTLACFDSLFDYGKEKGWCGKKAKKLKR